MIGFPHDKLPGVGGGGGGGGGGGKLNFIWYME